MNPILFEALLFLISASLFGLVIGWVAATSRTRKQLDRVHKDWQERMTAFEIRSNQDQDQLEERVRVLGKEAIELKAVRRALEDRLETLQRASTRLPRPQANATPGLSASSTTAVAPSMTVDDDDEVLELTQQLIIPEAPLKAPPPVRKVPTLQTGNKASATADVGGRPNVNGYATRDEDRWFDETSDATALLEDRWTLEAESAGWETLDKRRHRQN